MSEGSPQAEKMEEKESPMTMVYCRLTESVRMPMSAEGTQAVDSPTDLDHASPHDLEPVAAHTRPTAEKPAESRMEAVHGAGVRAGVRAVQHAIGGGRGAYSSQRWHRPRRVA